MVSTENYKDCSHFTCKLLLWLQPVLPQVTSCKAIDLSLCSSVWNFCTKEVNCLSPQICVPLRVISLYIFIEPHLGQRTFKINSLRIFWPGFSVPLCAKSRWHQLGSPSRASWGFWKSLRGCPICLHSTGPLSIGTVIRNLQTFVFLSLQKWKVLLIII